MVWALKRRFIFYERWKLKQMLSSLLESGTMSMSDVDSVLYKEEAQKYMDVVEIPRIGYSIHRQVHHITVPRRFSRTGGRHPVYGRLFIIADRKKSVPS